MEASLRDEVQRTIEQARLYNVQLQQAHAQYTLLQAWKQFASVALAEGYSLLPYVAWSRSWRRFQEANVAANSVFFMGTACAHACATDPRCKKPPRPSSRRSCWRTLALRKRRTRRWPTR